MYDQIEMEDRFLDRDEIRAECDYGECRFCGTKLTDENLGFDIVDCCAGCEEDALITLDECEKFIHENCRYAKNNDDLEQFVVDNIFTCWRERLKERKKLG